jgi:hypothetical protein
MISDKEKEVKQKLTVGGRVQHTGSNLVLLVGDNQVVLMGNREEINERRHF